MEPLQRHQLVWLNDGAWQRVLATAERLNTAAPAADCLAHWAQQRWPLVVARQPAAVAGRAGDAPLALGLPAPARWGRQAIAVSARAADILQQGAFPAAAAVAALLPANAQAAWGSLCTALECLQVQPRVYGSFGWQLLTGLPTVHAGSDIDLLLPVHTVAQADLAAALLQAARLPLRLDGELVFTDGAAVAWREWIRWRCGDVDRVLVKRLHDVRLEAAPAWAEAA